MKNLNQNKINKIVIGVLIVLILVLGYRALTEHKRVTYYVCYDWATSTDINRTHEEAKEMCKERND